MMNTPKPQKRIGDIFLERKLITNEERDKILEHSREKGLRFGESALDLGIVKIPDLVRILGPSYKVDYFALNADYFPVSTKDLLNAEEILRFGALPLGFKTSFRLFRKHRLCNVGLLTPGNKESIQAIEKIIKSRLMENQIKSLKIYLILADQYLEVLNEIYGVTEEVIQKRPQSDLDETLLLFLERN